MRILHSSPRRAAPALLAAALIAGCGEGGGTPPPDPLTLQSSGRLERSDTVTVSVRRDGQAVPAAEVALTVTPSDAAQVLPDGRLVLLRTGDVQVRASAGGRTGTLTLDVAAPPTVVFDMVVGGNRDIYRVALDGGDLTRLTTNAADDRDPSTGGGKVVFVSYRASGAELWTLPLAGGAETRITNNTRAESAPAFSADGQRLAFAADPSGVAKLWTSDPSGSGAAAATSSAFGFDGSPETSPAWAPTGARLAFVAAPSGLADIYQLTLGGQPALLAGGPQAEVDPAWSPDGQHLAFASTRDDEGSIYLLRVSDGTVTRLSTREGAEAEPGWTKDGRLVYTEFSGSSQARLVWINPASPSVVHPIPIQGGIPRRPSVAQ